LKLLDMLRLWTCLDIMSPKKVELKLAFALVNAMHKTELLHNL